MMLHFFSQAAYLKSATKGTLEAATVFVIFASMLYYLLVAWCEVVGGLVPFLRCGFLSSQMNADDDDDLDLDDADFEMYHNSMVKKPDDAPDDDPTRAVGLDDLLSVQEQVELQASHHIVRAPLSWCHARVQRVLPQSPRSSVGVAHCARDVRRDVPRSARSPRRSRRSARSRSSSRSSSASSCARARSRRRRRRTSAGSARVCATASRRPRPTSRGSRRTGAAAATGWSSSVTSMTAFRAV